VTWVLIFLFWHGYDLERAEQARLPNGGPMTFASQEECDTLGSITVTQQKKNLRKNVEFVCVKR
jgi:hypothetical protein